MKERGILYLSGHQIVNERWLRDVVVHICSLEMFQKRGGKSDFDGNNTPPHLEGAAAAPTATPYSCPRTSLHSWWHDDGLERLPTTSIEVVHTNNRRPIIFPLLFCNIMSRSHTVKVWMHQLL